MTRPRSCSGGWASSHATSARSSSKAPGTPHPNNRDPLLLVDASSSSQQQKGHHCSGDQEEQRQAGRASQHSGQQTQDAASNKEERKRNEKIKIKSCCNVPEICWKSKRMNITTMPTFWTCDMLVCPDPGALRTLKGRKQSTST
jgi:hypothetical protein